MRYQKEELLILLDVLNKLLKTFEEKDSKESLILIDTARSSMVDLNIKHSDFYSWEEIKEHVEVLLESLIPVIDLTEEPKTPRLEDPYPEIIAWDERKNLVYEIEEDEDYDNPPSTPDYSVFRNKKIKICID